MRHNAFIFEGKEENIYKKSQRKRSKNKILKNTMRYYSTDLFVLTDRLLLINKQQTVLISNFLRPDYNPMSLMYIFLGYTRLFFNNLSFKKKQPFHDSQII